MRTGVLVSGDIIRYGANDAEGKRLFAKPHDECLRRVSSFVDHPRFGLWIH